MHVLGKLGEGVVSAGGVMGAGGVNVSVAQHCF